MERYLREPINGLTHLIGAVLSVIALVAMIIKSDSTVSLISVIIFGVSLILLYTASATYHSVITNDKILYVLRRLDHSMIFILIAGSYAPFCLVTLGDGYGPMVFIIMTITAIAGVIFKMVWFKCPRWLTSTIYIVMGWFSIVMLPGLIKTLSIAGVVWLVLGGIAYTIGGIIYGMKSEKMKVGCLGFHEVFHIFVIIGSLCHFISVFNYVL